MASLVDLARRRTDLGRGHLQGALSSRMKAARSSGWKIQSRKTGSEDCEGIRRSICDYELKAARQERRRVDLSLPMHVQCMGGTSSAYGIQTRLREHNQPCFASEILGQHRYPTRASAMRQYSFALARLRRGVARPRPRPAQAPPDY